MTPERGLAQGLIIDEAMRIKGVLVNEHVQGRETFDSERQERLDGLRDKLGYEAVPEGHDYDLVDTRNSKDVVIAPDEVAAIIPVSPDSAVTTRNSRGTIGKILQRDDDRLLVVVGPCSIHDPEEALEYAGQVKGWREEFGSRLEVVMRAYMEKPRTELGWKGLVLDPHLDESNDINTGLIVKRMVACQITHQGVPIAMERLNALTPQYVNGLVSYDAIGARNTTDQKAREYASGTSSPVGFKNTPEGSIQAAAQAVVAANGPHAFLGTDMNGLPSQINTLGNPLAHIILRGGSSGPNYSADHVKAAVEVLRKKQLLEAIVIDASHGNSVVNEEGDKDAWRQVEVLFDVAEQVALGQAAIRGVMIESNLVGGKQPIKPRSDLEYGKSITDECMGIEETEFMLSVLADAVRERSAAEQSVLVIA